MGLKTGTIDVLNPRIGADAIEKIYQGTNLVWQRSGGGGGSNVAFSSVNNGASSPPSLTSNGGSDAWANSSTTISSGGNGFFSISLSSPTPGGAFVAMRLMTAAGAPYGSGPAIQNYSLNLFATSYELKNSSNVTVADGTHNASTVFSLGFDGANRVVMKKDGVAQYTSTETYATANYILWLLLGDGFGAGQGLDSVIYG
jgi:hypothetical protein